MNQQPYIFTEMVGCAPIANVMIESFFRFHPHLTLHVYYSQNEMAAITAIEKKFPGKLQAILIPPNVLNAFATSGHRGTAKIIASVLQPRNKRIIHIDSDVVLLQECISHMQQLFDEGYDLIGSRRAYKNNPVGIVVDERAQDVVSTYFMGVNTEKISTGIKYDLLENLCQGAANVMDFPVLDFFDGVSFDILRNGGKVAFLDPELYGGQNEQGNKKTSLNFNLHLDAGEKLIHFGGVASGYAHLQQKFKSAESYTSWAVYRYLLFAELFLDEDTDAIRRQFVEQAHTDANGRWIKGSAPYTLVKELFRFVNAKLEIKK